MRWPGMPLFCNKCHGDLFCADCTEEYGQGFAASARADALEQAAMATRQPPLHEEDPVSKMEDCRTAQRIEERIRALAVQS